MDQLSPTLRYSGVRQVVGTDQIAADKKVVADLDAVVGVHGPQDHAGADVQIVARAHELIGCVAAKVQVPLDGDVVPDGKAVVREVGIHQDRAGAQLADYRVVANLQIIV